MLKKDKKFLLFSLLIICVLSTARLFNNMDFWLVDIFSHFAVQYALMALLLGVAFLWKRTLSLALFAGLLFVFNISVLANPGASAQAAGQEHDTFILYSANINKSNRDFSKLVDVLKETNADILLVLEVTEASIGPLQAVIRTYPHKLVNLNVGASGTGAVLMSRFPIVDSEITKYSEFGNMLISATLEIGDQKVLFYGAHFPRPTYTKDNSIRFRQFTSLARQINGQSIPVIVAGDFNATPYSPIFKALVKQSGLKDSREGFGWQPSWPTYFPFLWLPIDHILVSPGVQVHNRATGSYMGSDHYPVFAELSIG